MGATCVPTLRLIAPGRQIVGKTMGLARCARFQAVVGRTASGHTCGAALRNRAPPPKHEVGRVPRKDGGNSTRLLSWKHGRCQRRQLVVSGTSKCQPATSEIEAPLLHRDASWLSRARIDNCLLRVLCACFHSLFSRTPEGAAERAYCLHPFGLNVPLGFRLSCPQCWSERGSPGRRKNSGYTAG
jgi:hypothetical protein